MSEEMIGLFKDLEIQIIKEDIYYRCPDYCKNCVQCEFWKKFDKIRNDILSTTSGVKGCGKTFYKTERVGKRRSGHECTCGNNKWNYLCDDCTNSTKTEVNKNDN